MYRSDNIVGCIQAIASRATKPLTIVADSLLASLDVKSWSDCGLTIKCDDITPKMGVTAIGLGGMSVSCSIVCTTNDDFYLDVEPNVVWLTHDMIEEEFNIYSNVTWKIE